MTIAKTIAKTIALSDAIAPTEPLFREDAYLKACEAVVMAHFEDGAVLLDRTVFYPTGGGQPGDRGGLSWEKGPDWAAGEATVIDAVKAGEDGLGVAHRLAEGAALPPVGATVRAALDWDLRHLHMRMHTALHLLSVVIPLPVTGGQITAEKGRLDFDMPDAPGDKDALTAQLNALVEADHPVATEWITDEELAAKPEMVKTMAVKPPMGQGRVRLVRIGGAEAVDLQPCGGTHVARTGEIGRVALGKVEKKGKQNRRVNIVFA